MSISVGLILNNKNMGLKWGLKPFPKHLWEKFLWMHYKYYNILQRSMVKWMYLAIVDIKYSNYLMQFWGLMFIKQPFYCDLPSIRIFWREETFINVYWCLVVCVARMFYSKENALTFCLYIRLMNLVNNICVRLYKAEKRCVHHRKLICDSSWR